MTINLDTLHRSQQSWIQGMRDVFAKHRDWKDPASVRIKEVFDQFLKDMPLMGRTDDYAREMSATKKAYDALEPLLRDRISGIRLQGKVFLGTDLQLYDPKSLVVWQFSLPPDEAKGPRKSPFDGSPGFTVKAHPIAEEVLKGFSAWRKMFYPVRDGWDDRRDLVETTYSMLEKGYPCLPAVPTEEAERERLEVEETVKRAQAKKGKKIDPAMAQKLIDEQKRRDDQARAEFRKAGAERERIEKANREELLKVLKGHERVWRAAIEVLDGLKKRVEAGVVEIPALKQELETICADLQEAIAENEKIKQQAETIRQMEFRESQKGVFRTVCQIAICACVSYMTGIQTGPLPGGGAARIAIAF